jgi:hypothetical protein
MVDPWLGQISDPSRLMGLPTLVVESFVCMMQTKFFRDAAECFRVTQEEKAPGGKRPSDARDDGSRGLHREVHRHVAAENDVKSIVLPKHWVFLDEVSLFKRDILFQGAVQEEIVAIGAKVFSV